MYSYEHVMGIKEGGNTAILGATGPMGFLAIDYALHGPKRPKTLVITGRTQSKLDMAKSLYTVEEAKKQGVELIYVNTSEMKDFSKTLKKFTEDERGFDDVFIFAPNQDMVTYGEKLLAYDGCLNFFAGPKDTEFTAPVNFYNIHYNATHFVGSSGGNTEDMKYSIELIEKKIVDVEKIATHVLGLNDVVEVTKELPNLNGGKKIVYTQKSLPLMAVDKISEISNNEFINGLKDILNKSGYLWSAEAEKYLLKYAPEV
jgi:threonine dehydrogenase-like Zn-dependent dehydrogenase